MRIVVTEATQDIATCLVRALAAHPEVDTVDLVGWPHGTGVVLNLGWLFQPTRGRAVTWAAGGQRLVRSCRSVTASTDSTL